MNKIILNAIPFQTKSGNEAILGINSGKTLVNFWQWAYSDLLGNTERGYVAEYLVALACNLDNEPRISWDSYDLKLKNGIKVEVKSSAYLQTWKQNAFTRPVFGIQKTHAWNYIDNLFDQVKKRQADVYVFALLAHKDKMTANPLDTSQWEFYVMKTEILDKEVKDSKTITLDKIIKLSATQCAFQELEKTIDKVFLQPKGKADFIY